MDTLSPFSIKIESLEFMRAEFELGVWNDKSWGQYMSEMGACISDIAKNGIREPIYVWWNSEVNSFVLEDGFHRTYCSQILNLEMVPISRCSEYEK